MSAQRGLVTELRLRAMVAPERAEEVTAELRRQKGIGNVRSTPTAGEAPDVIEADLEATADEVALDVLGRLGVPPEAIALDTVESLKVAPRSSGSRDALIWAQMLGAARANAEPLTRYLLLMGAAGVVAAFGVVDSNAILIVGAMAVSPDLLPICSLCVGIVGRRPRLARRAAVTLLTGLGVAAVTAAGATVLMDFVGYIPGDFDIRGGGLGALTSVHFSTVLVAAAAGVAGILAFETHASAAIGVAISVTTIPVASYLGVAVGTGQLEKVDGAGAVLATNVAMLVLAGSTTLYLRRRLAGGD